ncbi:MAG: RNase H family protein [Candidatus Methylomirabilia bacterium]
MGRVAPSSLPRSILVVISGVCRGPRGPGGWGYVACLPTGVEREGNGAAPETTANRMELQAVIEGLRAIRGKERSLPVRVVSASQYVVEGAKGKRERKANQDLWEKLDAELGDRAVTWEWEPPHTMHYQSQAYDLACQALRHALKTMPATERP